MTFKSILCAVATAAIVAAAPLGDVTSALRALTRDTKAIGASTAAVLEKHFTPKRLGQSAANVPVSLCNSDADGAVLFANPAACQAYLAAPMIASPSGKFYSNCSASSLCLSFRNSLVTDFIGHPVVGVAGTDMTRATMSFKNAAECNYAETTVVTNDGASCKGNVLHLGSGGLTFSIACNSSSLTTITWQ